MDTHLSEKISTPVTIPEVSMAQVRQIVATLQAAFPAEHARIGRGATVLWTSAIFETEIAGRYRVQSCQESGTYYEATSYHCSCPDAQRQPARCKHSWAIDVLHIASAIAAREQAEQRRMACPVCGEHTGGGMCSGCHRREEDFARVQAATATVQARRAKVA